MTLPSVILCLTSCMTVQPLSLLSQTLEKSWLVFLLISLTMGAHLILSELLNSLLLFKLSVKIFVSVVPPFSLRSPLMVLFFAIPDDPPCYVRQCLL